MALQMVDPAARLPKVEAAVEGLGYRLAKIKEQDAGEPANLNHVTASYKRALWIVVLNASYGVVEIVGG